MKVTLILNKLSKYDVVHYKRIRKKITSEIKNNWLEKYRVKGMLEKTDQRVS